MIIKKIIIKIIVKKKKMKRFDVDFEFFTQKCLTSMGGHDKSQIGIHFRIERISALIKYQKRKNRDTKVMRKKFIHVFLNSILFIMKIDVIFS